MRQYVEIVILVLYLTETTGLQDHGAEARLLNHLLIGTRRDVRPVRNVSDPVVIKLDMVYKQMGELDSRNQIMTSQVWMRMFWKTPFLIWNPREYEGLDMISLKPSEMWTPDITLYNVITKKPRKSLFNTMDTNIVVKYNGQARWLAPAVLKTECNIAVRYFPFDTQTCSIKLGSWVHDSQHLDIHFKNATRTKADKGNDDKNNEWKLISVQKKRTLEEFGCCPVPFTTISYTVKARRRSSYYVFNLFLPCVIISSITLISFFLPPDSGERVSLVLTILLSTTVYMTVIAEKMPISSNVVPLVSTFFLVKLLNIALILVASCLIIHFQFKAGQPPSNVAYIVNQKLAKLVGLKKQGEKRNPSFKLKRNHSLIQGDENFSFRASQRNQDMNKRNGVEESTFSNETPEKENSVNEARGKKEEGEQIKETWPFAARVLNRLCFVVFLFFFLISTLMIFTFIPLTST